MPARWQPRTHSSSPLCSQFPLAAMVLPPPAPLHSTTQPPMKSPKPCRKHSGTPLAKLVAYPSRCCLETFSHALKAHSLPLWATQQCLKGTRLLAALGTRKYAIGLVDRALKFAVAQVQTQVFLHVFLTCKSFCSSTQESCICMCKRVGRASEKSKQS